MADLRFIVSSVGSWKYSLFVFDKPNLEKVALGWVLGGILLMTMKKKSGKLQTELVAKVK